jgi:hypothetical protein
MPGKINRGKVDYLTSCGIGGFPPRGTRIKKGRGSCSSGSVPGMLTTWLGGSGGLARLTCRVGAEVAQLNLYSDL